MHLDYSNLTFCWTLLFGFDLLFGVGKNSFYLFGREILSWDSCRGKIHSDTINFEQNENETWTRERKSRRALPFGGAMTTG